MSQSTGDLISREDTLTAFADYVGSGMSMDDYDALWNIVAKMPAVKQEPNCPYYVIDDDGHGLCKNHRAIAEDKEN